MLKFDEILHRGSCWNKARQTEMVFVLLGRDQATPVAIQAWIDERIRLGKNTLDDPQIQEALSVIKVLKGTPIAE